MSYAGATANMWQMEDVTDRLRMFLQAGFYLRSDLDIGVTTCALGQASADRGGGTDIPTQFFNGRDLPILCTLEQRSGAGLDTLTTEDVSISAVIAHGQPNYGMQVTLTAGPVDDDYTTALDARLMLRTHPVTGTNPPPVVSQGYLDQIFSAEFPAVGPHNFPYL
ncbi:hypothetical protein LCGC14_1504500, partial [marine sediment metagenome]